jgi:nicotinate-nucleotide pyrophosphorylase (carboxylating)
MTKPPEDTAETLLPPYLESEELDRIVARALEEDVGAGDVTSERTIPLAARAEGTFLAREAGIVAGIEVARRVFAAADHTITSDWNVADGGHVRADERLGTVSGGARGILAGERVALNFLQRMSGIASTTRRFVDAVEGFHVTILDTRKTAPGLRLLDKWAVLLGGGGNHRTGLFDMILIKENHIRVAGGVSAALASARTDDDFVEIEARTLEEVREILRIGTADRVLLDNMVHRSAAGAVDTSMLRRAVELVGGRLETEASGNVTLDTVREVAATGVNFISCGALTHSVKALDLSLLFGSGDQDEAY